MLPKKTTTHSNPLLHTSLDFFKQRHKKVDIAILSAMPEELAFFKNKFSSHQQEKNKIDGFEFSVYEYKNKRILLSHTGLGTTFAASIITFIHLHFRPSYILFSGTAGGIKPELKLCDVVIVEKAFEAEIQGAFQLLKGTPFESCLEHPLKKQSFPSIYSANTELLDIASKIDFSDINVHQGTVVSSNTFPSPQELFEKIKSQSPYSIDMETSAIYQIAWLLNIPVLAVRGISNLLNTDGTDDQIHQSDLIGSASAAAMVLLKIMDTLLLRHSLQEEQHETDKEVATLLKQFSLQKHPEGGYFSQTFKSNDVVQPVDKIRYNDEQRQAGTAIYYLLKRNDFSAWHRLKSDEIWHHHIGSEVKIYVIDKKGKLTTHLLGNAIKNSNAVFQAVIFAGDWFAAELVDKTSYCLVGCSVNPGFEYKDFELADRKKLSLEFPEHQSVIHQFTRVLMNNTKDLECAYLDEKIMARL